MPIPFNTLLEESKCYLCLGSISAAQAMELALLNRIAAGGSSDGVGVYRAILNQSGTNAPVATVLKNTLGFNPVWTRESQGFYKMSHVGGFPVAKTYATIKAFAVNDPTVSIDYFNIGVEGNWIDIESFTVPTDPPGPGEDRDDLLINIPIEILVYP